MTVTARVAYTYDQTVRVTLRSDFKYGSTRGYARVNKVSVSGLLLEDNFVKGYDYLFYPEGANAFLLGGNSLGSMNEASA